MDTKKYYELCHKTKMYNRVEYENRDVGGGTITHDEIDTISEFENFDNIFISGLHQDTFDYFIDTQAYKFKSIMFWKNKLVNDWSKLGDLDQVEFIGYFHNQRITEFWDMSNNLKLEGLFISDFTRLHSLSGIETAPALERFSFQDAVWNTSVLDVLEPLVNTRIKEFYFGAKSITHSDISVYTRMPELEILDFRSNMYTTEELAWLVANLPNVSGYALRPYIKFDRKDPTMKDVLICGKRKPFLFSTTDKEKIERYVIKFDNLVAKYRKEMNRE